MGGALGAADVLHSQMSHYLVHCRKIFTTDFFRMGLLGLDPQTRHFLFDRLSHIPEKGTVMRRVVVRSYAAHVVVVRHELIGVPVVVAVVHVHVDPHVGVVREVVVMVVQVVVQRHVLIVQRRRKQHRVRRGVQAGPRRSPEVVVLPPEQEIPRRVAGMGVQMAHGHPHVVVAVVEPVHVLVRIGRGQVGLRGRGHAVGRRRHFQPHAGQMVVMRRQ